MNYLKWMLALVFVLVGLVGCSDNSTSTKEGVKNAGATGEKQGEKFTYTKYELPNQEKLALGEENAPHTVTFVFDYKCPWCKKWMLEILPEIDKQFIQTGQAKYVSQPVSLLAIQSYDLAMVDGLIEKHAPDKYFEFQTMIAHSMEESNGKTDNYYGSKEHIKKTVTELGLNYEEIMKGKDELKDNINLTRNYSKNLGLMYVPTVYVDGIKMSDSFSIDEIKQAIAGEIKEGDITYLPVSE